MGYWMECTLEKIPKRSSEKLKNKIISNIRIVIIHLVNSDYFYDSSMIDYDNIFIGSEREVIVINMENGINTLSQIFCIHIKYLKIGL